MSPRSPAQPPRRPLSGGRPPRRALGTPGDLQRRLRIPNDCPAQRPDRRDGGRHVLAGRRVRAGAASTTAASAAFAAYINSNGKAAGEAVYRAAGDEITQLIRQGDHGPRRLDVRRVRHLQPRRHEQQG